MATTAVFVGVNALILLVLAVLIVPRRRAAGIGLGFGEDEGLKRAVRAHGNAVEYIPMAMIMLAALETLGAASWLIWFLGGTFTLGRVLHPIAIYRTAGADPLRSFSMAATWFVLAVGAAACLGYGALELAGS